MSEKNMYKWDKQMIKDFIDPTDRVREIGRTTLLAELYCDIASENPEIEIRVQDHIRLNSQSDFRAMEYFVSILDDEAHKRTKELIERGLGTMRYKVDHKKGTVKFTRHIVPERVKPTVKYE